MSWDETINLYFSSESLLDGETCFLVKKKKLIFVKIRVTHLFLFIF